MGACRGHSPEAGSSNLPPAIWAIFGGFLQTGSLSGEQRLFCSFPVRTKLKVVHGVKAEAMAMKQEEDGMIFCLVDCLPNTSRMNDTRTNEGGYEKSDLRKKLNGEILNLFPTEFKATMAPFDSGDLLRLPTEKEIFGKKRFGECEGPDVTQWEPMKKRRNRMAFDSTKNEGLQWYWLMNKARESGLQFSCVCYDGYSDICGASSYLGVRPVFKIKNVESNSGNRI